LHKNTAIAMDITVLSWPIRIYDAIQRNC